MIETSFQPCRLYQTLNPPKAQGTLNKPVIGLELIICTLLFDYWFGRFSRTSGLLHQHVQMVQALYRQSWGKKEHCLSTLRGEGAGVVIEGI